VGIEAPTREIGGGHDPIDAHTSVALLAEEGGCPIHDPRPVPLLGPFMKRTMGIDAQSATAARETTREALDFVAKEPGAGGYLVGERFTVADLTCAALLMPCVAVAEWGGPEDAATEKNRAWLARWAGHPGAEWVREIFRRHRRS
jgi:glutathione S-transferase